MSQAGEAAAPADLSATLQRARQDLRPTATRTTPGGSWEDLGISSPKSVRAAPGAEDGLQLKTPTTDGHEEKKHDNSEPYHGEEVRIFTPPTEESQLLEHLFGEMDWEQESQKDYVLIRPTQCLYSETIQKETIHVPNPDLGDGAAQPDTHDIHRVCRNPCMRTGDTNSCVHHKGKARQQPPLVFNDVDEEGEPVAVIRRRVRGMAHYVYAHAPRISAAHQLRALFAAAGAAPGSRRCVRGRGARRRGSSARPAG